MLDLLGAGIIQPGTPLFGRHKGSQYSAVVRADGKIAVAGEGVFNSPSVAANRLVGSNTNGWTFWSVEDGRSLADLRNDRVSRGPA